MESERMAALLAPFLGGRALEEVQLRQLSAYLELLLRWNARINLTAVREPEQIVGRHFGESLFAARTLYPASGETSAKEWLLDLGSGAGFPGLPIKIWAPGLRVGLIESHYRKAIFLREAARTLGLRDIEVFSARAEDFSWECTGNADSLTITMRAVERFEKVLAVASRLLTSFEAAERRLALLIGGGQVSVARQLLPGFHWAEPLAMPQSSMRVLLLGAP